MSRVCIDTEAGGHGQRPGRHCPADGSPSSNNQSIRADNAPPQSFSIPRFGRWRVIAQRFGICGLVVLGVLLHSTGCGHESKLPEAERLSSVAVRTERIEKKPHLDVEEVVGTVRPRLRARVEAKVAGRIERLPASLGQAVKQGDLLAELESREIQAKLDQAVAVHKQTERDLARFATLLRQEAVTQAEFDAAEARDRVAEAALEEARTMLAYTKVVAPFDGVIARKLADVGDLASPGRPLVEIEDPSTLQLVLDVPEALVSRVQIGAKTPVRIASLERPSEATVSEISPSANPTSRTFQVKLDLTRSPGLFAGQFGRAAIPVGESQTLRAPASAVAVRGQMEMVFVVTNQLARMRLVKTGRRIGDDVELVSGVSGGETIVAEGVEKLRDGQPVTIKP
jgi:RND family efflux transporter MFP subunit